MKPITNILLIITLVCYVFLPLFEISLVGSLSGLQFTASIANLGVWYTLFSLTPFITIFLAIAFNCLKNRYWGILVALLICGVIYYLLSLTSMFHGFSLVHEPEVTDNVKISEGMPIIGVGIGYKLSLIFTIFAFISALVSLMPFKFNKKLEETIDSHIGKGFESGKKHISKVSQGIHDEFHKRGKNKNERGARIENGESVASVESLESLESLESVESPDSPDSPDSPGEE